MTKHILKCFKHSHLRKKQAGQGSLVIIMSSLIIVEMSPANKTLAMPCQAKQNSCTEDGLMRPLMVGKLITPLQ